MDNYREVELLAKKTVGDSGTETIDINVDEPITELSVRFALTNGAATADEVPPEIAVTKIEIVDGGQVYHSVSAYEACAIAWYDKRRWVAHQYDETLSAGQSAEWPIQFGRYLGDPEYAFTPSKLLNPQLKVTWAKDTLHLTSVCTLEVNAKTMQGVAAPSQALLTKEITSWTTGASGIHEADLPTDYPYRRLYFRAYANHEWLGSVWTNMKLECDVGKLIVFDMDDDEFFNLMRRIWGEANYWEYIQADNGVLHQTHLGVCKNCFVVAMEPGYNVISNPTTPGYVRMYARTLDAGAENDVKTAARFWGVCPEYTYCYPFGLQDDPASWFRSARYGSIKLKLTEGSADSAATVLVQQPIPLP